MSERFSIPRPFHERGRVGTEQKESQEENTDHPESKGTAEQKRQINLAQEQADKYQIAQAHEQAHQIAKQIEREQISSAKELEPVFQPEQPVSWVQSLTNRFRKAFNIPPSISNEVSRSQKAGDFQAVDELNRDPNQSPSIVRKPSKLSRALLIGTAIGAIGMTHEPQLESAAKAGVQKIEKETKELEAKIEQSLTSTLQEAKRWIKRNKPFGKEAFAETGTEGSESSLDANKLTAKEKSILNKFTQEGKEFSPEKTKRLIRLIESVESHNAEPETFFLTMELIHGQITESQFTEAEKTLSELGEKIKKTLTAEELASPIRVAFEVAKHRETYLRDHSGLAEIALQHSGNCDALVRLLVAEVPKITTSKPEIAVQVYADHVRFLVRPNVNPAQSWEYIDGHDHGVLTTEEMKGTTIVYIQDFMEQNLFLKKSPVKNKKPETTFGYKTDSMLRWETSDERAPTKKSATEPIPVHIDEKKEINKPFVTQQKIEHTQFIEVSPEFFSHNASTPEKAELAKPKLIAPSEQEVTSAWEHGNIGGSFNDLRPLEGIDVTTVRLYDNNEIDGFAEIDFAPIAKNNLKTLEIDFEAKFSNVEKLNAKNISELSLTTGFDTNLTDLVPLIEHTIRQSDQLNTIDVYYHMAPDASMDDPEIQKRIIEMMKDYKPSKQGKISQITKLMQQKGQGNLRLSYQNLFEEGAPIIWQYDAKTDKWSQTNERIHENDYISEDTRNALIENKSDPTKLTLPKYVIGTSFLQHENFAWNKLKSLTLREARFDSLSGGHDQESFPQLNLDMLEKAKNIEEIIIEDPSTESTTLDLSSWKNLSMKRVIIKNMPDLKIIGLDSNVKIIFES